MLNITTIVGARPQFIKASAISRTIREEFSTKVTERILHTGQHYDYSMSEAFFVELGLPEPWQHLGVGSGTQGVQTASILQGVETALMDLRPDLVLVYGDTNSTLAGALAASKLEIPVVHVEAGLRSYDRAMPEEVNRVLTDHLSSVLCTPTPAAKACLLREGIGNNSPVGRPGPANPLVLECGDVMLDTCLIYGAAKSDIYRDLGIEENGYFLATIHRPSNTDHAANLSSILAALRDIAQTSGQPVVFPLHPRTRAALKQLGTREEFAESGIRFLEPQGYANMLALESGAQMVLTDSGGVQKEAYFFRKPCVILRDRTEWIEIVDAGWAICAGPERRSIRESVDFFLANPPQSYRPIFGDGKAGSAILNTLLARF